MERRVIEHERGLDRIVAADVVGACRGVEAGRVYDLGTDLGPDIPLGSRTTFGGFRLTPYRTPRSLHDPAYAGHDFSMELIEGSPHVGSHIDGLTHIQAEGRIHGGLPVARAYDDFGWRELGMETVSPIVARGVLLDVPTAEGVERLADGFEIGARELAACARRQRVDLRRGDVVLVRTGKFADFTTDVAGGAAYFDAQPGVGVEGALWLYERGLAVLGTDTSATEPVPFVDERRTTHRVLLVERGVHLIEILDLEALARDEVFEFLFVCLPLRIVGATGSWVRPIAVV
jgi:kynurenine formamidase